MNIFIEYLFIFIILVCFNKFSFNLYLYLGINFSKQLATTVDIIFTTSMAAWLTYNSHYILAIIGMTLLIKQNLDKDFQKRLSDALDSKRKNDVDKEPSI